MTVRPQITSVLLTVTALVAFAANSLLCRMALGRELIDPVSFATIRVGGGAAVLALLVTARRDPSAVAGSWRSALCLATYAIPFSLAYTSLDAGLGALVLFAAVQISMLTLALLVGERLALLQIVGFLLAGAGLVGLCWPSGDAAPSLRGVLLMLLAGIGWGLYSVLGRRSVHPLADTAGNFLRTVPIALATSLIALSLRHWTLPGVGLALTSGIVTSGFGYAIWYSALRRITTTTAAAVQLSVPVLAAIGGVVLLAEVVTPRLVLASAVILGGVALSIRSPAPRRAAPDGASVGLPLYSEEPRIPEDRSSE